MKEFVSYGKIVATYVRMGPRHRLIEIRIEKSSKYEICWVYFNASENPTI